MKPASVPQIRKELAFRSPEEIKEICLRLARFKKENKELLTYLLFEAQDETGYVAHVKEYMTEQFRTVNRNRFYFVKKSIRKILREAKKFSRYSNSKATEIELLLHFCREFQLFGPSLQRSTTMQNLFDRQIQMIAKKIEGLHPDLQYDYQQELEHLLKK
ncbi:MAG: hypothetical protein CMC35_01685 [Flavobacteriaceae bacterium]|nr:hypothetical protein [Flavobacteriaceae bacterium]|tara:strand:- start:5810 stop:6289 length:480 start_codon:yes stop_codon:yes gene_type:complete